MHLAKYQQGNVMPYILAIIVAMLMSAQYVFNAYKVSNEASRMQNTSDAAAYSIAAVYAQNYNFVALSNRALVANQITMAQVVTMVSWTRLLDTFATTINDIGQYIPYVSSFTYYIAAGASYISNFVENIAPEITQIIQHYIVTVSELQRVAVPFTSVIAQEILEEVVETNDSDIDYSLATVAVAESSIAHLSNLYGQNDCKDQADIVRETEDEDAGNAETISRCMQFRNVTLASRDGFTADRTYTFTLPGMPEEIIAWGAQAEMVEGVPLAAHLSIERGGGTTMGGDTPGVRDATPFTTWTALDTISLHASTTYFNLEGDLERTAHNERVKLGVGHAYVGDECSQCHHIVHEGTHYWETNPRGSACTDPDIEHDYGGGSESWNDSAFILMDVFSLDCQDLSGQYSESLNDDDNVGLTDFYNLSTEGYVEEKDHLMVYLRKQEDKIATASETVGGGSDSHILDRYRGAQNSALHGAAAAAVYFRRSNDNWMLDSARRLDGRMEFGNTYNPFWEPRLSRLTNSERAMLEVLKEQ